MALFGQDRPQIGGGWGAVGDLLSGGLQRVDAAAAADQMQINRREATGKLGWEKALEEAQMARGARIAREGLPQALEALGLNPALGQFILASDGGNVAQYADALGGLQSFTAGSNARQAALDGGWNPVNAELVARAKGPLELTKIQGDTYINPLEMPDQQSNEMTPLGDARIAKLQAPAGASGGTGGSGQGKAPSGYQWAAGGGLEPIPGGPADKPRFAPNQFGRPGTAGGVRGGGPVPIGALKLMNESREMLATTQGVDEDLTKIIDQIDSGELNLGLLGNAEAKARNFLGFSNGQSRNYASLEASMERLRNESLRLNKGVQTDGDAQRAWNELLANLNDPQNVKTQLERIRGYNQRARKLQQANLEAIERNYGIQQEAPLGMGDAPAPGVAPLGAAPAPMAPPSGRPLRYNPATGELE